MFKQKLLILLISLNSMVQLNSQQLTEFSEVFLLTYLPGDELYSVFGHSALRIKDPVLGIDYVYNYGTFDFSTPFFYVKFIKGDLPYQLSRTSFAIALKQMKEEKRVVLEQRLSLNLDEKNRLLNQLEHDYLPQNRSYQYRFFKNNCSTKIRDIIDSVISAPVKYESINGYLTYRNLVQRYTDKKPWVKLGIDLMLGKKADRRITAEETMFLPDYLTFHYALATVKRNEGIHGLATRPKTILESDAEESAHWFPKPSLFFIIVVILMLVTAPKFYPKKSKSLLLDWLLFGSTSLYGLVVLFVTIASEHAELQQNSNLIWALPALPILLLQPGKNKRKSRIHLFLYLAYVFVLLSVMIGNRWFQQSIPVEVYPFLILLIIHTGLKTIKLI